LIGNLPAWRTIIDQHACPAASITCADGVGNVIMGSPTVLINNQMACRIQDIVVEKPGLWYPGRGIRDVATYVTL
jgi:uncharacterized Zn-binding protein involved in type VI secretion